MANLTPEYAVEQAEKLFGPKLAHSPLFEDWFFNDNELQVSGPIIQAASYAVTQQEDIKDAEQAAVAVAVSVDAVFMKLGLTTEHVRGLLNGSYEVRKKPH